MQNVNIQDLVQAYLDGLETLGVEISKKVDDEDKDTIIYFKDGNGKFILSFQNSDPGFVTILFPNFYPVESEEEYVNTLMAAASVTRAVKSAKVMHSSDDKQVSIAAEFFDYSTGEKTELLKRYIGSIEKAVFSFLEEMKKLSE